MLRMAGAIGKSTEVLHAMQSLIKVPEISQTMLELSREMSKVRWYIYTDLIIL